MAERVAVLMGGMSAEREVSLASGRACAQALVARGYDVVEIDAGRDLYDQLVGARPDCVVNVLHGEWGEDGRVQGVLDHYGVAYTHSGVLASALAMDKERAKAVFAQAGLDVPRGMVLTRSQILADGGVAMEAPFVAKPPRQGSSVGVFIVQPGDNRFMTALADPDWAFGEDLLVEEFVPGRELTTAVMGDRALGVTEIIPRGGFYDYDAKYAAGGSVHEFPAKIESDIEQQCLAMALKAHEVMGCAGLTRSDFRFDVKLGRVCLLEINTIPGMTSTSLAPEQAAHLGISFEDLVVWMVEDAHARRAQKIDEAQRPVPT